MSLHPCLKIAIFPHPLNSKIHTLSNIGCKHHSTYDRGLIRLHTRKKLLLMPKSKLLFKYRRNKLFTNVEGTNAMQEKLGYQKIG